MIKRIALSTLALLFALAPLRVAYGDATSITETVTGVHAGKNISLPVRAIPSSNAIDWVQGAIYSRTLSANTTFTFANSISGQKITVYVTNIASAPTPTPTATPSPTPTPTPTPAPTGDFTVTWPGGIKWPSGSAPTQTTGAHTDKYTFENVNGIIYGTVTANF